MFLHDEKSRKGSPDRAPGPVHSSVDLQHYLQILIPDEVQLFKNIKNVVTNSLTKILELKDVPIVKDNERFEIPNIPEKIIVTKTGKLLKSSSQLQPFKSKLKLWDHFFKK